jgi:hypothetical protein
MASSPIRIVSPRKGFGRVKVRLRETGKPTCTGRSFLWSSISNEPEIPLITPKPPDFAAHSVTATIMPEGVKSVGLNDVILFP